MPNEEVLGPRKTMFVLVIVVGCFAVLWPKILSPLILGGTREQLKPNAYDREAGCCEMIFDTEVAILEILNEICSSIANTDGKLSPYAAADCRRAVNDTCGVDIAAFLKRTDNVGKTAKVALDTMKASNSSCLKEHFGVPTLSLSIHPAMNSWILKDTLKQERPPIRVGAASHPALRERGRAIPAAGPPPRTPTPLPPHHRVPYQNPLSGYFEIDIKVSPENIVLKKPGLLQLIFKRSSTVPYDSIASDPQFRRRVFRDDSRSTPDRLVVTAISGLVAEVQQQMEATYAQNQQTQDVQDNHARPYTNGTVIHSGPVQIVASEYREPCKEKSLEIQKEMPEPREASPESYPEPKTVEKEISPEKEILKPKEASPEPSPEPETVEKDISPEKQLAPKELTPREEQTTPETDITPDEKEFKPQEITPNTKMTPEKEEDNVDEEIEDNLEEEIEEVEEEENDPTEELIKLTQKVEQKTDTLAKLTGEFLEEEKGKLKILSTPELERKTSDLLEEALIESSPEKESEVVDQDNGSVKVVGMEVTAHSADGGQWPRAAPPPLTPLPPPRPPSVNESTLDDFTTASGFTQPAEKEDDLSEEEEEMEIEEIEEIEEEVEEEEVEEEPEQKK
ncbi:probable inactive protein kinase DDB_G0270444 [Hyposmocoma kahamanoa]|uniref:probable inactive protein kinase DDB_G0270444 n=1 Tax=Hyposmocoma kahamanoa TaxID=1477025 RepID=UPI000E6D936B|nr:probable inactive protein kinase DDB_G0270444 [Hyposmocoma kahamanoa]